MTEEEFIKAWLTSRGNDFYERNSAQINDFIMKLINKDARKYKNISRDDKETILTDTWMAISRAKENGGSAARSPKECIVYVMKAVETARINVWQSQLKYNSTVLFDDFEKRDKIEYDVSDKDDPYDKKEEENYDNFWVKHIDSKITQRFSKWFRFWGKEDVRYDFDEKLCKFDQSIFGFTQLEKFNNEISFNPLSLLYKYDLWLFSEKEGERYWMDQAILIMKESKDEKREKVDPMVGAVLVDENGNEIARACRGEIEGKGHCEYNLLQNMIEKKNNSIIKRKYIVADDLPGAGAEVTELNIDNATLYVTLEPYSCRRKGKCSCADRIIYAKGIKRVFVGLKDPDKDIDGQGIKKLEDAGIKVEQFYYDKIIKIISAKRKDDGVMQNFKFMKSKKDFYEKDLPELFRRHYGI